MFHSGLLALLVRTHPTQQTRPSVSAVSELVLRVPPTLGPSRSPYLNLLVFCTLPLAADTLYTSRLAIPAPQVLPADLFPSS